MRHHKHDHSSSYFRHNTGLFKFKIKCGKELRCLNTKCMYGKVSYGWNRIWHLFICWWLVCYRQIDSTKDTLKLQKDIDQLGKWARIWGMRFQPVKCNIMQLTRKWIKNVNAVYSLEGTILENVDNIKYLGMTISKDLKWNTHVSNVCTKASKTPRFLRRNLRHDPKMLRKRHTKGWCDQSWSMLVLFGTHME